MDYSLIKKELLLALRGNYSQKEMSEKLGFKFNQYHKWESDIKWLRWDEFIHILETVNSPYKKAFSLALTFQDDPKNIKLLFEALCPNLTMKEVGEIVGHNEAVVRRWINKDISPSFETILKLINLRTNNLHELIGLIVDIEKIPSLIIDFKKLHAQKLVEIKYPFASAIEAALQLDEYAKLESHSDKWIADRILVSENLVKNAIKALLEAETIKKNGTKYITFNQWIQVPGLTLKQVAKIDKYWTSRCLDRYSGPEGVPYTPTDQVNTNIRTFRVAPVSEKAASKIQKILKKTSGEILKAIQDDHDDPQKIIIYVSHFFDVNDIKWKYTDKVDSDSDL